MTDDDAKPPGHFQLPEIPNLARGLSGSLPASEKHVTSVP